jgi:5-methylcytosine-specific restriction endonuclease McrA
MCWKRKGFEKRKQHRTMGRRWMSMRHVVLVEEPVCKICGRRPSTQVDHINPLCKGGTDIRVNLQGVCDYCHDEKTARDLGIKAPPNKIGLDGYPILKERDINEIK